MYNDNDGDRTSSAPCRLREDIIEKNTFSFGHCPKRGGGGFPMPKFFGPFYPKLKFL